VGSLMALMELWMQCMLLGRGRYLDGAALTARGTFHLIQQPAIHLLPPLADPGCWMSDSLQEVRLTDGAGQRPAYSLRALCRALDYARRAAPAYGLARALWDGFSMSFLTQLAPESGAQLQAIMVKYLLPGGGKALKVLARAEYPWVSHQLSVAWCGVVLIRCCRLIIGLSRDYYLLCLSSPVCALLSADFNCS